MSSGCNLNSSECQMKSRLVEYVNLLHLGHGFCIVCFIETILKEANPRYYQSARRLKSSIKTLNTLFLHTI